MTCHCCNGEAKRFGYFINKNFRVQRFRCLRCAKTFSDKQPLDGTRIATDDAVKVVELLSEGLGIRGISRLTRLDQKTVLNVLKSAGEHCSQLLNTKSSA